MSHPFDSINKIEIFEKNHEELKGLKSEKDCISISNHWNRKDLICIELNGETVAVLAEHVIKAIQNAQNAHKY